jgi:hypothetical protein
MTQPRGLTTPQAVVAGSAIVSLGLFLGLRGQAVGPAATEAPGAESAPPTRTEPRAESSLPSRAMVSQSPSAPQVPARAGNAEAGRQRVQAALDALRSSLEKKCYAPSVAKAPQPVKYKVTLLYSFGPDGQQLSRGTEEDRSAARPDVTSCITEQVPLLELGPEVAGLQQVRGVIEFP